MPKLRKLYYHRLNGLNVEFLPAISRMTISYKLPPSAICEKEGCMYLHQEEKKSLKKFFCVAGGSIRLLETKLLEKIGIEIIVVPGVTEAQDLSPTEIKTHPKRNRYCFYSDSVEEANSWISYLIRCTLPFEFLGIFIQFELSIEESEYNGSLEHNKCVSQFPIIKDMPVQYRRALLWKKIRAIALHFDFQNPEEESRRSIKQNTLMELLDVVSRQPDLLNDPFTFQELMMGIELGLYRPQPREEDVAIYEDDSFMFYDPEWSHLSILYEILINLVTSTDIDSAIRKHNITTTFVIRLISLFDSIDSRERECLKTAVHRIYGKLTNRRAIIRKTINHTFYQFLYETHCHHGISELLEILASIINGFSVPIRPEHIVSLEKSLLPLHKMQQYEGYSIQLTYCMSLYASKDHSLSKTIIPTLLRYWPTGNSNKEILFISEIEEILEQIQPQDISSYLTPLFKRIAKCVESPQNQIAERAICLLTSNAFNLLILKNHTNFVTTANIIYNALRRCSENHSNIAIQQMAQHVIGLFFDVDFEVMNALSNQFEDSSAMM